MHNAGGTREFHRFSSQPETNERSDNNRLLVEPPVAELLGIESGLWLRQVPLSEDLPVVLAESFRDLTRVGNSMGEDFPDRVSLAVSSHNSGISIISHHTRSWRTSKI